MGGAERELFCMRASPAVMDDQWREVHWSGQQYVVFVVTLVVGLGVSIPASATPSSPGGPNYAVDVKANARAEKLGGSADVGPRGNEWRVSVTTPQG
jgi:hypothetical protein